MNHIQRSQPDVAETQPGRILIVDDQEVLRFLLRRELAALGHEVDEAPDGPTALHMLRQHAFDIVLLDIMMPGMDGIEVLHHIKSDPDLYDLPVIVVSADIDIDHIVTCIRNGADDYVFKPYNIVLLNARINASLERKRLRDRERRYRLELERMVAERTADLERSQEALRLSEERYALAARGANDGLWDWNIAAGTIYFSPRWKEMLGYAEDEIGHTPGEWFNRIHPDDRELFEVRLMAHFRRLLSHFQHEYRILHRDGSYRWMLCRGLAVWDQHGQAMRIAGSQTDITDRKKAEQQLQHDALHDSLTGLPNRVLFTDRLERAIVRLRREPDRHFAVLFLDLDRFKVINDSLGHEVGDQLLVAVAVRLQESVRPNDTVARLGGDEFTILLEPIEHEQQAEQVAERIQHALSAPLYLQGHQIVISSSIGIAYSSSGYAQPADLIRDADTAMYHAKLRGKACYVRFDPSMHTEALAKLQLEQDLRLALERNEFRLFYQPIVLLRTGAIVGFEALIRWQHPQRGLLAPGEFLPLAEETGLIVPMTWWVLEEACRQMQRWHEQTLTEPRLSISVNLSGRLFSQPDLIERLQHILDQTGLPPQYLKLEITEHTFIEFGSFTNNLLEGIRNLGVELCIDDFGTGYSSLSYLHTFPVNVLKIDRSFVNRLDAKSSQGDIVQTIIQLAHNLNMEVVAEGIETPEQFEQLKALACSHGQGWLFAPALSEAEAQALIGTMKV
ncbi:diguanylate cyclase [Chloroflexus islandicus]|uniref:Diguanylate cyclase n=1 Tax=Chloroflexus islandicus TaxID=1707952 RepID=A0A178MBW4_9CHLR|nr:EAL domain-containing protein [Chloroflexus islandicus]OAN46249.1 diguanylate cyclase [Chloroflexus islandicus]